MLSRALRRYFSLRRVVFWGGAFLSMRLEGCFKCWRGLLQV
jgi:hypothetical protein